MINIWFDMTVFIKQDPAIIKEIKLSSKIGIFMKKEKHIFIKIFSQKIPINCTI